ncbi:MAG: ParB/RepB/Spo0J family partition protein [Candidatus Magasanikbacteria bacterium]|nr:ParB/RepB/Spo0J family partition protein [Candidatus Magasanikbacteria bacterium]
MSLGRGLGALITPISRQKKEYETGTRQSPVADSSKIWTIPVSEILANAKQPRTHFDPEALQELSVSIKEYGILQPILVAEKRDGGYELIAGERRWRAAKLAGLSTVPALVKQLPELAKLEISLIENIQRADLNSIEEAFAYKRLTDEFNLTQQQVADKIGKSRPAVANTIRLLELPDEVQKALIEKRINTGQARALLSLKNEKEQLDALSSMLGQKISVRELEKVVQKMKPNGFARRDPNLAYIEQKLRATLGTKVNISQKGERGIVAINYYSKEELARVIKKIIGE